MLFGHRRDPEGYCDEVSRVDAEIEGFIKLMNDGDLLFITADHGCDPTFKGSDHTREHIPLLMVQKGELPKELGIRKSFADIAQTLSAFFQVDSIENGISML